MHPLLARQIKKFVADVTSVPAELRAFIGAVNQAYVQADEDRAMLERSMDLSSRELLERNTLLTVAERKYREIFENVTEGIFQATPEGTYLAVNPAMARILGYDNPAELKEAITDISTQIYVSPTRRAEIVQAISEHGIAANWESEVKHRSGSTRWVVQTVRAVKNAAGDIQYFEGTFSDVTGRKQAERQREELQDGMLTLSRQAGMAEVATGVLHNVGNVLNGLNVSLAMLSQNLEQSKLPGVGRIAELLHEHRDDLPAYFSTDEKAKKLPLLLRMLFERLQAEKAEQHRELASLSTGVEHINNIIMAQQSYARGRCVIQEVEPAALVEDAIGVNAESLARHHIQVIREFAPVATIQTDKHQVLQILINLITNAKQAMSSVQAPRTLTLRLQYAPADASRLIIQVCDVGVGIAPEHQTQIFSHGFTTRPDGHGFGLHSAALAAKNMGGSLRASSGGPNTGAEFTLELPLRATNPAAGSRRAA